MSFRKKLIFSLSGLILLITGLVLGIQYSTGKFPRSEKQLIFADKYVIGMTLDQAYSSMPERYDVREVILTDPLDLTNKLSGHVFVVNVKKDKVILVFDERKLLKEVHVVETPVEAPSKPVETTSKNTDLPSS